MSAKVLTTTTTTTTTKITSNVSKSLSSLTFLSLRFLQTQAPPPNPSLPPLPFLLPAFHHPASLPQRQQHQQKQHQPQHQHYRTFTTTTATLKKSGGKQSSKRPPPNLPASKADVDVNDLTDYKDVIARTHESLKTDVKKIGPGGLGRDLEGLEGLRVQVADLEQQGRGQGKGPAATTTTTTRLRDLAQVVPRGGRSVAILVGDKDHIKPILSALSSPPHNLNPSSPSDSDPLTLLIPLPPITQESRAEAAKTITARGEAAQFALREARGAQRKRLRALGLGKLVSEDELHRAEKELDKVNEGAVGEAKRVVEEGRKRVLG